MRFSCFRFSCSTSDRLAVFFFFRITVLSVGLELSFRVKVLIGLAVARDIS